MAGREGLEPSNARSKAWCLTNLATAHRIRAPPPKPDLRCDAESTQYQRRTGELGPSGASLFHSNRYAAFVTDFGNRVRTAALRAARRKRRFRWKGDVIGRLFRCQSTADRV